MPQTNYAWIDNKGRPITQTAYEAQKNAGVDVSGYKPYSQQNTTNTQNTVVNNSQLTNTNLQNIQNLPQYQALLDKGYTHDQIVKAINTYNTKTLDKIIGTQTTNQTNTQNIPKTQTNTNNNVNVNNNTQNTNQQNIQQTQQTEVKQTNTQQTPLTPLPLSQYKDDSEQRLIQIVDNLNRYRQTNPVYMKDLDTFRKTFSYDLRSDTQKKLLDNWYLGYQKGVELNSKTINDLVSLYNGGLINDNDLEQLRLQNPDKYNQLYNLIDQKNTIIKYDNQLNKENINPFQSIIETRSKNMLSMVNAPTQIFEEYKNAMNSKELTDLKNSLLDKEGEIKQIDEQINMVRRNVEEQYKGTGATRSKINAIIQDETWKLQEKRNSLAIEYQTLASKYNNQISTIKDNYEIQMKQYELERQQRTQQMQELGFMMNLINFETNAQKDERERQKFIRQEEYKNGNIYSNDPIVRRKAITNAVENVLKEFEGIPMVRSKEQMVKDIENLVNQGYDLGTAITENIRKPIMKKPQYQAWLNKKLGIENQQQKWSVEYDSNGNPTIKMSGVGMLPENISRQQRQQILTGFVQNNISNGISFIASQLQDIIPDGQKYGQCGVFANDIAKAMGTNIWFGDKLSDKTKWITPGAGPEVGNFIVMKSKNNPGSGHVGIITGINPDGTIRVKSSNYKGDERVRTDNINPNSSMILGYVKPKQTETIGYDKGLADVYKTVNEGKSLDISRFSKELGIPAATLIKQAQARKYDTLGKTVANVLDSIDFIEKKYPGRILAMASETKVGRTNPELADFYAEYKFIKDNLTLDKLVSLKNSGATFGALSDSERIAIGNAANAISLDMSEENFKKQLNIIRETLKNSVGGVDPRVKTKTQENPFLKFKTNVNYLSGSVDVLQKYNINLSNYLK